MKIKQSTILSIMAVLVIIISLSSIFYMLFNSSKTNYNFEVKKSDVELVIKEVVDLKEYISLEGIKIEDINFTVSDDSIVSIVNNTMVAKKTGSTKVKLEYGKSQIINVKVLPYDDIFNEIKEDDFYFNYFTDIKDLSNLSVGNYYNRLSIYKDSIDMFFEPNESNYLDIKVNDNVIFSESKFMHDKIYIASTNDFYIIYLFSSEIENSYPIYAIIVDKSGNLINVFDLFNFTTDDLMFDFIHNDLIRKISIDENKYVVDKIYINNIESLTSDDCANSSENYVSISRIYKYNNYLLDLVDFKFETVSDYCKNINEMEGDINE